MQHFRELRLKRTESKQWRLHKVLPVQKTEKYIFDEDQVKILEPLQIKINLHIHEW